MPSVVHVEIIQKKESSIERDKLLQYCKQWYEKENNGLRSFGGRSDVTGDSFLVKHVESLIINSSGNECGIREESVTHRDPDYQYYVYQLENVIKEDECVDEEDNSSAAVVWALPSRELHGLWDSLIYETSVKDELLNFASSSMLFSDSGVRDHIVGVNRVVLLHGPPGTGKTSLCKALAHKMAIRWSSRFTRSQLIEINSHSLFSKYFSESGKLIMKMFSRIHEMIADAKTFVCVLIDEVESLAHARAFVKAGVEPSDSLRAVNALLTQIDAVRKHSNVLILTTSNITDAIDLAFVDRADIKKYIGLPTVTALYKIYSDCLTELMRTNIIYPKEHILSIRHAQKLTVESSQAYPESALLMKLAKKSEGLSGRTVRKIPFLAHANYLQKPQSTLHEFLFAMEQAIQQEILDRSCIQNTSSTTTSTNGTTVQDS